MAGILDFYGYDNNTNGVISQKQQQSKIDNKQNEKIKELEQNGGEPTQSLIKTTYSELKSLRDNSQLIPGCWYRITDYETTTRQSETQSAGHLFDVIVFAIDNKTLSEEAWAINHVSDEPNQLLSITITDLIGLRPKSTDFYRNPESDGDFEGNHYYGFADKNGLKFVYVKDLEEKPTKSTLYDFEGPISEATSIKNFENTSFFISSSILLGDYFANSNLSAWKLKYCLDNDIDRFKWAVDDKHEGIMIEYDRDYYTFKRYPEGDKDGKYAWVAIESGNVDNFDEISDSAWDNIYEDDIIYTNTPNPNIGDEVVWLVDEVHTNHLIYKVKKLGKGVIYWMKDEFDNEAPYDFKNILQLIPIDTRTGFYDSNGVSIYCYLFNYYDADNEICCDMTILQRNRNKSMISSIYQVYQVRNNKIGKMCIDGFIDIPRGILISCALNGLVHHNSISENCQHIFLGIEEGEELFNVSIGNDCSYIFILDTCYCINIGNLVSDVFIVDSSALTFMDNWDYYLSPENDNVIVSSHNLWFSMLNDNIISWNPADIAYRVEQQLSATTINSEHIIVEEAPKEP